VQGTIEQSENPLALAIAGQGFFSVALPTGSADGQVTFDERQFFTRGGDFQMDRNGYMVNGAGYILQGWNVDAAGEPDRTQIQPIRISELVFNPIATSSIEISANLPAGGTAPAATTLNVYDSLGVLEPITLTWTPGAANVWTLEVSAPGAGGSLGTIDVNFGQAASTSVPDGTIGEFVDATGTLGAVAAIPGDPALASFAANFGQGLQPITLNLGAFGAARGVTQYAGDEYAVADDSLNDDQRAQYEAQYTALRTQIENFITDATYMVLLPSHPARPRLRKRDPRDRRCAASAAGLPSAPTAVGPDAGEGHRCMVHRAIGVAGGRTDAAEGQAGGHYSS